MFATELLAAEVVDAEGVGLGPVRDVRLATEGSPRFRVVGIVVGGGRLAALAHAWGHAAGRAEGPALFRLSFRSARRQARFVPVADVASWGPGEVKLSVGAAELRPLTEVDAE